MVIHFAPKPQKHLFRFWQRERSLPSYPYFRQWGLDSRKKEIGIRVLLHCLCRVYIYTRHNNESTHLSQYSSFYMNCPSSLSRNKAKNALSLAKTISPVLARAKIGKSFDSTIRSESNFLLGKRKRNKFCER